MQVLMLLMWLGILSTSPLPSSAQSEVCGSGMTLRLVPTLSLRTSNTGRLEICKDGRWGTIQTNDMFWSTKNLLVACQQLGFMTGLNSIPAMQLAFNDLSDQSFPVFYEGVMCDGREGSIEECDRSPVPPSSFYDHTSDVFIVCVPGIESYTNLHTLRSGSFAVGDLRLVGSVDSDRGAVEIATSVGWSSICPDLNWEDSDAEVVCQNLGYESGVIETFTLDPRTSVDPRMMFNAECINGTSDDPVTNLRIRAGECTFNVNEAESRSLCDFPEDVYAGVICRTESAEKSVRLFSPLGEGDSIICGTVEVLNDNRWGFVCRPFIENEVSESVCQGLGYERDSSAIFVRSLPLVDTRLKPVWIPDLACDDSTTSLAACSVGTPLGYGGDCVSEEVLHVSCTLPRTPPLSSGAIVGIVFATLAVLFLVVFVFIKRKSWWENRHNYSWFNNLEKCWRRCARRNTASFTTAMAAPHQAQRSQTVDHSHDEPAPAEPELPDREFTKTPPPSYHAAATLPSVTEELPPPYPGPPPSNPYPPPSGAANPYPPPSGAANPYPPPPQNYPPSAPPLDSAYPPMPGAVDPAYPPPTSYPPFPYPP